MTIHTACYGQDEWTAIGNTLYADKETRELGGNIKRTLKRRDLQFDARGRLTVMVTAEQLATIEAAAN